MMQTFYITLESRNGKRPLFAGSAGPQGAFVIGPRADRQADPDETSVPAISHTEIAVW